MMRYCRIFGKKKVWWGGVEKRQCVFRTIYSNWEVYKFDMMNFFTFYRTIMEKINLKPPFTLFQQLVLRLIKVAPCQLNLNAWLMLVTFKYLCTYIGGLYPSLFSFFYFFNYSSRTHGGHIYFTQRLDASIFLLRCRPFKDSFIK